MREPRNEEGTDARVSETPSTGDAWPSERELTAAERELAARAAMVAAPRFDHFGWTYGWRDGVHVPDVEGLAQTIERLLKHGGETISSGRLLVMRDDSGRGLYDVEVYLQLGTISDGEVDVDNIPRPHPARLTPSTSMEGPEG